MSKTTQYLCDCSTRCNLICTYLATRFSRSHRSSHYPSYDRRYGGGRHAYEGSNYDQGRMRTINDAVTGTRNIVSSPVLPADVHVYAKAVLAEKLMRIECISMLTNLLLFDCG